MLRRFVSFTFASLVTLALSSAPRSALAADELGKSGVAASLEILTPSADTYLQYHGRLILQVGEVSEEYRWGGTSCGSRTISDDMVRSLVVAVSASKDGVITPRFQLGQGDVRCLVGFTAE